jgi:hypothetical protein
MGFRSCFATDREERCSGIMLFDTTICLLILTQALFAAQGKLLADATKQVFELQTQRKETQHKIDRLRDYERQIEQHIRMQRLWSVVCSMQS